MQSVTRRVSAEREISYPLGRPKDVVRPFSKSWHGACIGPSRHSDDRWKQPKRAFNGSFGSRLNVFFDVLSLGARPSGRWCPPDRRSIVFRSALRSRLRAEERDRCPAARPGISGKQQACERTKPMEEARDTFSSRSCVAADSSMDEGLEVEPTSPPASAGSQPSKAGLGKKLLTC